MRKILLLLSILVITTRIASVATAERETPEELLPPQTGDAISASLQVPNGDDLPINFGEKVQVGVSLSADEDVTGVTIALFIGDTGNPWLKVTETDLPQECFPSPLGVVECTNLTLTAGDEIDIFVTGTALWGMPIYVTGMYWWEGLPPSEGRVISWSGEVLPPPYQGYLPLVTK